MLNNNIHKGIFQLTLAMFLAGVIGVFVIESGQNPYNIVFLRCLIGSISLALICFFYKKPQFSKIDRKTVILLFIGGACLVYNWLFLFKSYQYISLSLGTVIYHVKPFFILIFGAFLFRESLTKDSIVWTSIAFIGTCLIVELQMSSFNLSDQKLVGILFALVAAIMYSISTLIVKYIKNISGVFIAFVQTFMGIFLLIPFTSLGGIKFDGTNWIYIVLLGTLNTGVMYSLSYSAYQKLPSYSIAILSFIYPIVTILTDYLFYGFSFNLTQMVGVFMIFIATLGVNLKWNFFSTR